MAFRVPITGQVFMASVPVHPGDQEPVSGFTASAGITHNDYWF